MGCIEIGRFFSVIACNGNVKRAMAKMGMKMMVVMMLQLRLFGGKFEALKKHLQSFSAMQGDDGDEDITMLQLRLFGGKIEALKDCLVISCNAS